MHIKGIGKAIAEHSERQAERFYFWLGQDARHAIRYQPPLSKLEAR